MKKVHIIVNGVIENSIAIESIEIAQQLFPNAICRDVSFGGQIGDLWDGQAITPAPIPPKSREGLKDERAAAVAAIKVTTASGRTFDGDETSQGRMVRAIIALNAQPQTPVPTVNWVLANNTAINVTAAELTEALTLSGAAQAAVWVLP